MGTMYSPPIQGGKALFNLIIYLIYFTDKSARISILAKGNAGQLNNVITLNLAF